MSNPAAVLVLAVMAQLVAVSSARAEVDLPKKATGAKVSLVRAYAPCVTPNDTHTAVAVLAACSPATPLSPYSFGPTGKGTAQALRAGFLVKMRFELQDVRTAADQPADGVNFSGRVRFRFTDDGCSGEACTFETFLTATLPCSAGRCFGKLVFPEQFVPYLSPASAEVTGIEVDDELGNRFATMGLMLQ